jgi:hypothetical protein
MAPKKTSDFCPHLMIQHLCSWSRIAHSRTGSTYPRSGDTHVRTSNRGTIVVITPSFPVLLSGSSNPPTSRGDVSTISVCRETGSTHRRRVLRSKGGSLVKLHLHLLRDCTLGRVEREGGIGGRTNSLVILFVQWSGGVGTKYPGFLK